MTSMYNCYDTVFLVWILRFTAFGENIAFTSSQTVQESEDKSTYVTTSTYLFVDSDPPKVVRPYPTMYLHNWCCNKRAIRVPLSIKAWCCHIHDYSVAPIIDTLRPRHRKNNAILQITYWSAFPWIKRFEFRLKFPWSELLRVQLVVLQHWFR